VATDLFQAHRIIAQIVLTGGRVFGKAFAEAYKQAQASSQYAKAAAAKGQTTGTGQTFASAGLTLDEACRILNVKPPMAGKIDMPAVMDRFKKLYDLNDPKKGGSFYIQSKVLRARERIEMEVRDAERKAAFEEEIRKGWKPKMYRD
jgi:mitochondrial import inner membrane translocase subunit TIM16